MCFWKTDNLWNHWKNLKYTFFYCMCIFTCFRDRCIDSKWTGASISKKSENARTRKKHAFWVFSMISQKVLLQDVHFLQKDTFLYLGHFDKAVSCTLSSVGLVIRAEGPKEDGLIQYYWKYWIYWNIEIFQYFWKYWIYWNIELFQYYFNILKILKYWSKSIFHENVEILK